VLVARDAVAQLVLDPSRLAGVGSASGSSDRGTLPVHPRQLGQAPFDVALLRQLLRDELVQARYQRVDLLDREYARIHGAQTNFERLWSARGSVKPAVRARVFGTAADEAPNVVPTNRGT
jgi:hypothetical protein